MNNRFKSTIGIFTFALIPLVALAEKTTLPDEYVEKNGKQLCIYNTSTSSWEPGISFKDGTYLSLKDKIKSSKGQKKGKLKKKSKASAKFCKKLSEPKDPNSTESQISNLSELPDTKQIVKSGSQSLLKQTSGTPPTIAQIASMNSDDLIATYWRTGVVDAIVNGTPSQDQCREFFGSNVDGESGGLGSCFMTQGVAHAFEPVLQSGTSLCYMKNFPTQENVDAGAVKVTSGKLDDITKIFAPSAQEKIVQIKINGEQQGGDQNDSGEQIIYIKTFQNSSEYQAAWDLWFCDSTDGKARGYENIRILNDGTLQSTSADGEKGFGTHEATISASIIENDNGSFSFDPSKARSAQIAFKQSFNNETVNFKADILISADGLLSVKSREDFGQQLRFGYSVANAQGNNLDDLRFYSGAVKDRNYFDNQEIHGFSMANEYRDSIYLAAPGSNLASLLDEVNFDSDSFYSSTSNPEVDSTNYPCNADVNFKVTINMDNQAMQAVAATCEVHPQEDQQESEGGNGRDFCRNDTIEQAEEAFFQKCVN